MSRLLAIDWGSSSLRGALIDDAGAVLEQRSAPKGMLTVDAGGFDGVFEATFGDWMDVPGTRCLMAGMVGSRQGWVEAPYRPCPAGLDDYAGSLQRVGDRSSRGRDIAIVPGATCEHDGMPDVMRGEEIKIVGVLDLLGTGDARIVSPGTHSKWCRVEGGRLIAFSTAMSGEFYALLSRHSILAHSVSDDADDALDEAAFDSGVERAFAGRGLLQNAFSVRTFALFERMPAAARASYLSGLVIGEELRGRDLEGTGAVALVGADALTARFARALASRGVVSRSFGDEAAWRGLWCIDRRRCELEGTR
ncbi:2-dehydro-3-deoxygalactonokinase [Piscinibacter koreensis]|uniref:2-dehydro-3-deoxygalactonokinase n=1 Tax=Piscinibacter koreensis TaxID=2742824 RepID=A0A7Y6NQY7_9BURK|nr:2-dehydro-3-deoxygalactonokinase [Schlegelella koreensis]NUZ07720.1 2-dehydro-3-deoxygalactonokinase [Schlegelella koreensis]